MSMLDVGCGPGAITLGMAEAVAPEVPGFLGVCGPWRLAAVGQETFVGLELELFGVQKVVHIFDLLVEALEEPVEDPVGGGDVGGLADRQVIQGGAIGRELLEIGLEEEQP